jgi:hypothetical protein
VADTLVEAEMSPHSFMPGSNGRLDTIDRRPGETLFDYMTRCHWILGGRVRLLESIRDAQKTIFVDGRSRWRRHMILLAIGEAGFASSAYILFEYCGVPTSVAGPLMPCLIGLCALIGAWMSINILSMRETFAPWMIGTDSKARLLLRWIMPVIKTSHERNADVADGTDRNKGAALAHWPDPEMLGIERAEHLSIDAALEERVAEYLEMESFMWRLRLLFAETAIIAVLTFLAQLVLGRRFLAVIDTVGLIVTICLVGGFLALFLSNFVSTRIARLSRWWRHHHGH